ncbi:MAG: GHKL domain-containing protein [Oligoflexus sp.]|nr:GHKL domain-containing protein [Oligoflexus sp.]
MTVFVTFIQLFYDYRNDVRNVASAFSHIEDSNQGTIAAALWHVDVELVEQIYKGLASLPMIDYVRIEFLEGTSVGESQPLNADFMTHTTDLFYQLGDTKQLVGHLTLGSDTKRIYNNLGKKLLVILLAQGAKTFLVAIFMLLIFEKLIMRQLRKIAAYARELQFRNPQSLPAIGFIEAELWQGELKDVSDAIIEMQGNIEKSYRELEQTEQQLRRLNLNLEMEVKRRSQENAKQQLLIQHSFRLSSLGQMAGSIAHEINNPLTIIAGYVRIIRKHLKSESMSPEKLDYFGSQAELTIERISEIIRGLLRLSGGNSQADDMVDFVINDIVKDAVNICRDKFQRHSIEFTLLIQDLHVTAICRPIEIGQIIINLLNNAFDAVKDQSKPWIQLELKQGDKVALLSITDGGPSIPMTIRSRILEPFFTTKPYGQGTGLGLSISKAIADKHHGRLYLDELASSTRFVLELPSLASSS